MIPKNRTTIGWLNKYEDGGTPKKKKPLIEAPYVPPYAQGQDNTHIPLNYIQQQQFNKDNPGIIAAQTQELNNSVNKQRLLKQKAVKQIQTNIDNSNQYGDAAHNATGDKMRFFPENPDSFVDNYLNPLKMVGDMADNLAHTYANPDSSVGDYALAAGLPLVTGAIGGIGENPIKKGINSVSKYLTEETALKNAYKLNPYAFKANSEMGYRILGEEGYKDVIKNKIIRAKPAPIPNENELIKIGDREFNLAKNTNRNPNTNRIQPALDRPYFADGFIDERYGRNYLAEVDKIKNNLVKIPTHKGIAPEFSKNIPVENASLYKKDWLQGYKEIPQTNYK